MPVNPDFVPWAHELIAHLAAGAEGPRSTRPGEPLEFPLDPPPPLEAQALPLTTPSGRAAEAPIDRRSGTAKARYAETGEAGIYRLTLPTEPPTFAYAAVVGDLQDADPAPLDAAEVKALEQGWPLTFDADPARLASRVLKVDRARRNEVWRALILAALGGLCLEVWLTRRMARRRGAI